MYRISISIVSNTDTDIDTDTKALNLANKFSNLHGSPAHIRPFGYGKGSGSSQTLIGTSTCLGVFCSPLT